MSIKSKVLALMGLAAATASTGVEPHHEIKIQMQQQPPAEYFGHSGGYIPMPHKFKNQRQKRRDARRAGKILPR